MFYLNTGETIRQIRKTKAQKQKKYFNFFVALVLGVTSFVFVFNSLATIIEENDVRVDTDAELTYYLNVKEDGVDASGIESSDGQIADVRGGRINVTDRLPEGLIFQGFVTTSDGTIGAVSRSDSSVQCSGKVIDDTEEEIVDSGTWNAGRTEYYYHGLHYNTSTRTVSFMAEKIKAGCELTVGIITKTPATVDDSSTTDIVEKRRDFYNTAFVAEKNLTATSNTVHAWIGSSTALMRNVRYSYTGNVPAGAPNTPSDQSYPVNNEVTVSTNPVLEGYTFSGWTTSDVTMTDGEFVMPDQDVELVGIWVQNLPSTEYTVSYVINGDKPADFMPPSQKSYEAGIEVSLDSTEAGAVIDGYRFSGWSTADATLSETGFTMPEQNVTIAGSFERISYTVCYEFEGAILPPNASSLLPNCETHYPGDTVTTAANPSASGYDFLGWYKNATFTMPESNVVIHGEWAESLDKFIPTIAKSLVDAQPEYTYGETVKFKITVTNPESFAISDVYLQEQLAGAVFITSPTDSYTVKASTVAVIPTIAAGSSVDVFAEYKATENTARTLTNTVELTGALAENHVLDTDREYIATVDFNTVPEPVPFTGIVFNVLPYIGLIVVAAGIVIIGILTSRRLDIIGQISRLKELISLRSRRMRSQHSLRYILPGFAILGLILGGVIVKNVVAENYTEVVKSVELTSQHVSFSNGDPGSWHVTKSAKWIAEGKARITFDVDTIAKAADQTNVDIVMVIDNSGSMYGEKMNQVKHDVTELIESILSDSNNRIGLVSFNTTATKLSNFTSDKTILTSLVNGLDTPGSTNYYDGLKKAEEVLNGYQKQDNRELILLFLTDGFPNEQTPNEIPEYQALKAMYPYMTINAIQYEMGDEILDPIKNISDNQYIASMDSLNNVLFEASISHYTYDNFILTDYINEDYWDVNSIDNIAASIGEATLGYSGSMPVVTWTITDLLKSGRSAQLTIDVTLKNANSIDDGTFLPTNDHETVQSELPETTNENITSSSTPVLKSSYQVSYEANLPNDCTSYTGSLPDTQNYLPLAVVEKSSSNITCNGYIFAGWEIAEGNPKIINDDYFKIVDNDVILRATWTKPSISKSMDGEVKEEVFATLNTGQNVNVALKRLSGQSNPSYSTQNTTITAIRSASTMSQSQLAAAAIISTTDSAVPIYAWFDDVDGSIYIYSEADHIRGNTNMSYMFYNASKLTNIDGAASWDTSSVTNMSSMFSGASGLTSIDGAASWDTSSVTNMGSMFYGASGLTNIGALSGWDTSSVTNMYQMFRGASNLTNIDGATNWNTGKVTNMSYMFYGASSLTSLDGA
ncbi:MAG: BspA family leucine-rich repeat surface protein, partial [Candidatus Saccharibacteria bacterium]|nr:BspA family leucine-rich repeat surface protein [Candidatus Saccharibacteria bacterium]